MVFFFNKVLAGCFSFLSVWRYQTHRGMSGPISLPISITATFFAMAVVVLPAVTSVIINADNNKHYCLIDIGCGMRGFSPPAAEWKYTGVVVFLHQRATN